jgi:hypothetical protein
MLSWNKRKDCFYTSAGLSRLVEHDHPLRLKDLHRRIRRLVVFELKIITISASPLRRRLNASEGTPNQPRWIYPHPPQAQDLRRDEEGKASAEYWLIRAWSG